MFNASAYRLTTKSLAGLSYSRTIIQPAITSSRRANCTEKSHHEEPTPPLPRHALLKPHLNYRHFAENVDAIALNIRDRNFKGVDIRAVVQLHARYTSLVTELNGLRSRRNELSALSKNAPSPEERQPFIEEGKRLKDTIQTAEAELATTEEFLLRQGLQIPNDTHSSAPIGPEPNARVLKIVGTPNTNETAGFELQDHVTLARRHDLLDLESASLVSGTSFYYLKNDAALLELALVQYAMSKARSCGFTPVITPDVVRTEMTHACGFQPRAGEMSQIYDVSTATQGSEASRMCLAGTAEVPLAGMYAKRVLGERELPVKMVGFGRAFRAEAGARGADTKGLYRVHQFSKVELFALTTPEGSEVMMEEIRTLQENIFDELGLCFRVLDMPTQELGASAYRKYDMEAWMPGRNGWGEVSQSQVISLFAFHAVPFPPASTIANTQILSTTQISSTSNCTDYQSRRLSIRYRPTSSSGAKQGPALEYVHTLNGTAIAVPRIIIAVLENFQRADGTVVIPEVLRGWMGGRETIG
ncbi:seryl-tRNA synthetase [Jimgerdemannia flammicorona]|uniref:Seryl-tRNA synthetase n=2 Tax=Jimgerdemannia flammicorona TaxID=994334 RepID=A0A433QUA2_9FUNG|nr:seryl-tRNA synthetase [Jimgerdemannia flammicorona]RUS33325.1 seryl-tRNA synthetase [Jimgerdemannia flammicorona]